MSSFFFQAEDSIRDSPVTGVQTCALPISSVSATDVAALTLDASVLETIYVFTDDIVSDAVAAVAPGTTVDTVQIDAFDPEALEAVYTLAEVFKSDASHSG